MTPDVLKNYYASVEAEHNDIRAKVEELLTDYQVHDGVITPRKRSLGQGNIFAPVCHSVHGGSTWAGTPPWAGTPQAGTPPGQVHSPRAGTPPRQVHPLPIRWSICWWYASYWNAFLFFFLNLLTVVVCHLSE